jgi:hypothetical protein
VNVKLDATQIFPLETTIDFVARLPEMTVGVVGVTSVGELDEIVRGFAHAAVLVRRGYAFADRTVLTPSLWPKA